jgi:NAD(P)-dependent dehydrogenase (short-subunit alcohol dehydrogenase family)
MQPDSLVFGASGLIGRFLVAELLRRGHTVAAAARGSGDGLTAWLTDRGVPLDGLAVVRADITRPDLGLPPGDLTAVRDVYNCAVAKRLGMTLEGVRREAWPYEGVRHDKQIWAVLASEWPGMSR